VIAATRQQRLLGGRPHQGLAPGSKHVPAPERRTLDRHEREHGNNLTPLWLPRPRQVDRTSPALASRSAEARVFPAIFPPVSNPNIRGCHYARAYYAHAHGAALGRHLPGADGGGLAPLRQRFQHQRAARAPRLVPRGVRAAAARRGRRRRAATGLARAAPCGPRAGDSHRRRCHRRCHCGRCHRRRCARRRCHRCHRGRCRTRGRWRQRPAEGDSRTTGCPKSAPLPPFGRVHRRLDRAPRMARLADSSQPGIRWFHGSATDASGGQTWENARAEGSDRHTDTEHTGAGRRACPHSLASARALSLSLSARRPCTAHRTRSCGRRPLPAPGPPPPLFLARRPAPSAVSRDWRCLGAPLRGRRGVHVWVCTYTRMHAHTHTALSKLNELASPPPRRRALRSIHIGASTYGPLFSMVLTGFATKTPWVEVFFFHQISASIKIVVGIRLRLLEYSILTLLKSWG